MLKLKYLLVLLIFLTLFIACENDYLTRLRNGIAIPDIALPNRVGDTIDIKNLQGQLVLVEFWASWCGPCRQRHPKVDAVYKKFKDAEFKTAKGFSIYAISMDTEANLWEKSIQKEKISDWPYHLNDLEGMGGKVAPLFQFTQIPTSYLINEKGIIIGKDLTPENLAIELKFRLKNPVFTTD